MKRIHLKWMVLPMMIVMLVTKSNASPKALVLKESAAIEETTAIAPSSGDGSQASPYQMANLANLRWLSETTTAWDKYFIQTANIDATETNTWNVGDHDNDVNTPEQPMGFSPIGNSVTQFKGTYDGDFHSISNLFIYRPNQDDIGFIGAADGSAIIKSIALPNVIFTGNEDVGIVGQLKGSMEKVYATGRVTGTLFVGGLAGSMVGASIKNAYSDVVLTGDVPLGGVVGGVNLGDDLKESELTNVYAIGSIVQENARKAGGLIGASYASASVTNSYWDTVTTEQSTSEAGTGRTTAQMKDKANFTDWDFEGVDAVWAIEEGEYISYPYLVGFTYDEIGTISASKPKPGLSRPPAAGSGTEVDPYLIASLADLRWLSETPEVWGAIIKQTADIDATETKTWNNGEGFSPIGSDFSNKFTGTYLGDGHVIRNLYIKDDRDFTSRSGFFGWTNSATISKLGIENITIDAPGVSEVGALVGYAEQTTVSESFATGSIIASSAVGGLIGRIPFQFGGGTETGKLSNSYSDVSLQIGSFGTAGGLIGSYNPEFKIENSYAIGALPEDCLIGGLVRNGFDSGTAFLNISNSFWDTETTGVNQSFLESCSGTQIGGNGKSTAEMIDANTYITWSLFKEGDSATYAAEVWRINPDKNLGYPFLAWQKNQLNFSVDKVTDITNTSASFEGRLLFFGEPLGFSTGAVALAELGFVYGTTPNPSLAVEDLGGIVPATGELLVLNPLPTKATRFSLTANGLLANTPYYVRGYAKDLAEAIAYSNELIFHTHPIAPIAPSGDGSRVSPYQIASLNNLFWLSITPDAWDKNFEQTADIDATSTKDWYGGKGFMPIGTSDVPFAGQADGNPANFLFYRGNGHTIKGLYINRPKQDNVGLFGTLDFSNITDLGLENVNITGKQGVGGFVGNAGNSVIRRSFTTGSVTGTDQVGGFMGVGLSSELYNNYARTTVKGTNRVGGFLGDTQEGYVYHSYSAGAVTLLPGESLPTVGGFHGNFIGGTGTGLSGIVDCFWDTETSGQTTSGGEFNPPQKVWGVTTEAMKTIASYTNSNVQANDVDIDTAWDFKTNPNNDSANEDIWQLGCGNALNGGYPILSWQYKTPVFTDFNPKSSVGGAVSMTVTGTNLQNVTSVSVGGISVTGFSANETGTQLSFSIANPTAGAVVISDGCDQVSKSGFTVVSVPDPISPPIVTQPAEGAVICDVFPLSYTLGEEPRSNSVALIFNSVNAVTEPVRVPIEHNQKTLDLNVNLNDSNSIINVLDRNKLIELELNQLYNMTLEYVSNEENIVISKIVQNISFRRIPGFTYLEELQLLTGQEMQTFGPIGNVIFEAAVTISPALPQGLLFNSKTGAITGTPQADSETLTYTVTVANECGEEKETFMLGVSVDTDGDGIPDNVDIDDDNDGILDVLEGDDDSDGDGFIDRLDIDSDNDGIPDNVEAQATDDYVAPLGSDSDSDGLDDAYEGAGDMGLDPVNTDATDLPDYLDDDSDDDTVPDTLEAFDTDKDGKLNIVLSRTDTDADGLDNAFEGADTNDGFDVNDGFDTGAAGTQNTDAEDEPDFRDLDDDNDGLPTAEEDVNNDGDPTNDDSDRDGTPNFLDTDDDGDGVKTADEDASGDGNPLNDDADADGIPNFLDTDDDGDGIGTADEDANGDGNPLNDDADADGIPDYLDTVDSTEKPEPETPDADKEIVVYQMVTPNNDGRNDVMIIEHIEAFPNNTVQIFNRWGRLVWQTQGYDNSSNAFGGIANVDNTVKRESRLPSGTYFYVIQYTKDTISKKETGYCFLSQ